MSSNAEWRKKYREKMKKSADFLKKRTQKVCKYRALRTKMRNAEAKPREKHPVITTRHRADNQREK